MAIIKCKMCGGDLILEEGSNVAECEYCGSRQTVPSADNEKELNLFARANRLRANNEFDKATGVYESIVADFPEEAEAYWGLILCKYGIEYVDDPGTGKKIPTCHRSSFDSVMDDPNFELVMEYADTIARRVYREEAKQLEELRKGIIEVSSHEEPYDIFICYKETDEKGDRTLDSVLAQDVYDMLTENGYRVFFSRVTLEDKLGVEYEPYIFAALNSAKIMLAFGTDYDYYNAVWVKNEWSRFLQLIAKGEKKTLIPCYKNIDAYDMPKEFAKLQAQDLGKVGANQDLLRGIKKILPKEEKQAAPAPQQVIIQQQAATGPTVDNLLRRGNIFLEEKNWDSAKEYFNKVLDIDAENAEAYLGLMLTAKHESNLDTFVQSLSNQFTEEKAQRQQACPPDRARIAKLGKELVVDHYLTIDDIEKLFSFDLNYSTREASAKENKRKVLEQLSGNRYFTRAKQYAAGETKAKINRAEAKITAAYDRRIEKAAKDSASSKEDVLKRYQAHLSSREKAARERNQEALKRREEDYQAACKQQAEAKTEKDFEAAIKALSRNAAYKDSQSRIDACKKEASRLKEEREKKEKAEAAHNAKLKAAAAKKKKKIGIIAAAIVIVLIAAAVVVTQVIIPGNKYKTAEQLLADGKYDEAIAAFEALGGYKDSRDMAKEASYQASEKLYEEGKYEEAIAAFRALKGYKDSEEQIKACEDAIHEPDYQAALDLLNAGEYVQAREVFLSLGTFRDSAEKAAECVDVLRANVEAEAEELMSAEQYTEAITKLRELEAILEADEVNDLQYSYAAHMQQNGKGSGAAIVFGLLGDYKDAKEQSRKCWDLIARRNTIAVGQHHSFALKTDGTVLASTYLLKAYDTYYDGEGEVDSWRDIIAIEAGPYATFGLKADGTMEAVGTDGMGQLGCKRWTDIVSISACNEYCAGIKADGTVVSTKYFSGVKDWKNIIQISASDYFLLGLRADGTVVCSKPQNTEDWKDVIQIASGFTFAMGLKSDGTVLATGVKTDGWANIIEISAGDELAMGLKDDGTVISTGQFANGPCDVHNWSGIVAIAVGVDTALGLCSNGTVTAASADETKGTDNVSGFTGIAIPNRK